MNKTLKQVEIWEYRIEELVDTLKRWEYFYNRFRTKSNLWERIHSSIGYKQELNLRRS